MCICIYVYIYIYTHTYIAIAGGVGGPGAAPERVRAPQLRGYTIPYFTIHTIRYCIIWCYTILHCTKLYYTLLYYTTTQAEHRLEDAEQHGRVVRALVAQLSEELHRMRDWHAGDWHQQMVRVMEGRAILLLLLLMIIIIIMILLIMIIMIINIAKISLRKVRRPSAATWRKPPPVRNCL